MALPLTFYIRARERTRVKPIALIKGEVVLVALDYNNYLADRSSTTISTSTFAAESNIVSSASATNSGGIAGCTLTASSAGATMLTHTAVLANGETLKRRFRVSVTDPLVDATSDY